MEVAMGLGPRLSKDLKKKKEKEKIVVGVGFFEGNFDHYTYPCMCVVYMHTHPKRKNEIV